MSCTVDSTSGNVGELTDRTFETVADALHLQNSVIGDKKIAPAPPEIVAQIIAETERRLKGQSPSLTPTPITEQAETSQIQNVILSNARLKKNQNQIFKQIEIMKKLTLFQERDNIVEESQQTLIEVEAQLSSFQKSLGVKDSEILQLKEEKAATEIALKAVVEEKSSVDKGLENLRGDVGKVEKSFRSMKQDLKNKSAELDKIQMEKNSLLVQVEEFSKCVKMEKQKAKVTMTENKSKLMDELQSQKVQYEDENVKEKDSLKNELCQSREKLSQTESELKKLHQEIETLKGSGDGVASQEMMNENKVLKDSLENIEKQHNKELSWQKQKYEKLETNLSTLLSELTDRPAVFDTNVELLSSKLREITGVKDQLETELDMAKKKYEITMLEQQNQVTSELQKLARELETVKIEKQRLENQLFEIQRIKSQEIEEYQSQLSALDEQLQLERQQHEESIPSQETNQKLEQELEKEKGRVAGLMQTNSSLKQHVSQLKEVLARRESSLVDVQRHMEGLVRKWQEGEEDYNKSIHNLEEVLQQEKDGQRELKIQKSKHERTLYSTMRPKENKRSVTVSEGEEENVFKEDLVERYTILEQYYEEDDHQSENQLDTMKTMKNEHKRAVCSPSNANEAMRRKENKRSVTVSEGEEENVFKEDLVERYTILEQYYEEDDHQSENQLDTMKTMKNEHKRAVCSPSNANEAMRRKENKRSVTVSEGEEENVFKEDLVERYTILEQYYEDIEEEPPVVDILENKFKLREQNKILEQSCQEGEILKKKVRELERKNERLEEEGREEYEEGNEMVKTQMEITEEVECEKARSEEECEKSKKEVRELEREKARLEEEGRGEYEEGNEMVNTQMEITEEVECEKARSEEELKCKKCLTEERQIVVYPCGHYYLCEHCFDRQNYYDGKCLCMRKIVDYIKV